MARDRRLPRSRANREEVLSMRDVLGAGRAGAVEEDEV
jgi:hypothetical protein